VLRAGHFTVDPAKAATTPAEKLIALKGHGFSRAAEVPKAGAALAAEKMQIAGQTLPQGLKPADSSSSRLAARLRPRPFKADRNNPPPTLSAVRPETSSPLRFKEGQP